MIHDALCPVIPADQHFPDMGCQCWLIAKVRADERSMCAGAGQNHNENVMELTEDAVKDSSQILK